MEKYFMQEALKEAKRALYLKEVPVGAVMVKENTIIARAHNLRETLKDPTAHAEVIAIQKASTSLGEWRLSECELYVTLEPCPMCAGAILQSRIKKVHIGTFDPRAGASGTIMNILQCDAFNHWVEVEWTYNKECSDLLTHFFQERRERGNINGTEY